MSEPVVHEQEIVEALRRLSSHHWPQVLDFIRSLESQENETMMEQPPIRTAAELLASPLVGMWFDRTDIEDTRAFASRLREQAEHREGPGVQDAARKAEMHEVLDESPEDIEAGRTESAPEALDRLGKKHRLG